MIPDLSPPPTDVGVTATRLGLTAAQLDWAEEWLTERFRGGARTFAHGDCVGGDVQLATIADRIGYTTIAHPPTIDTFRAFHPSTVMLEPQNYLVRNATIAFAVEELAAFPKSPVEQVQGGTWWTVRRARMLRRPVLVVAPRGGVRAESGDRAVYTARTVPS